MNPTKAELLEKIAQLEKQQHELFELLNSFAAKCKISFHDVYNKVQAHEVYFGQIDKNIKVHDELVHKICSSIDITFDNNNGRFN